MGRIRLCALAPPSCGRRTPKAAVRVTCCGTKGTQVFRSSAPASRTGSRRPCRNIRKAASGRCLLYYADESRTEHVRHIQIELRSTGKSRQCAQEIIADSRMCAHERPLRVVQRGGLPKNRRRHIQLADVVKKRPALQRSSWVTGGMPWRFGLCYTRGVSETVVHSGGG